MLLSRSFAAGVVGCLTISSLAASIGPKVTNLKIREQDRLQDIVSRSLPPPTKPLFDMASEFSPGDMGQLHTLGARRAHPLLLW